MDIQPFVLSDSVDSSIAVVAAETRRKSITLLFSISGGPMEILGDKSRTRQIILNLLSNSTKFTPPFGVVQVDICVSAASSGPTDRGILDVAIPNSASRSVGPPPGANCSTKSHIVWIAIKDSGCGMNESQLSSIFEPFVQARSVGSSRGEGGLHGAESGTGLGLSIVKKLLELLGGGCTVQSAEGVGTSFLVWFPANVSANQPLIQMEHSVAISMIDSRESLAVESLLRRMVSSTAVFPTSRELMESRLFKAGKFSSALVDDIDGFKQCQRERPPNTVICLVTGGPLTRERRISLEKEGIIAVSKPLCFDLLRSVLSRSRHNRAGKNYLVHSSSPANELENTAMVPKTQILVVDDNQTNLFVMSVMLQQLAQGDKITLARNGEEALQCLRTEPYDVVLMDIHMPRLSGWEAARQVRENPDRFQWCGKIVALTAANTLADRDKSLRYMDYFLAKPVMLQDLANLLTQCAHDLGIGRTFIRQKSKADSVSAVSPGVVVRREAASSRAVTERGRLEPEATQRHRALFFLFSALSVALGIMLWIFVG